MTTVARRARLSIPMAAVCLLAGLASPPRPAAAQTPEVTLTTPVRQTLHRVQEDWQAWKRGYYQNNREAAASALQSLREAASALGMGRLPELAAAAAAYAHRSAAGGNYTRAGWALEDARALDPSRPEIAWIQASVARRQGDYLQSGWALARGIADLLRLEATRTILVHNVAVWLILVVFVAGACFLVVQMAVKGGGLIADLSTPLASLPQPAALAIVLVLLLWPLLLPAGLLWLLLYWLVLLYGYGSASERVVMVILLVGLGTAPVTLRLQQRAGELARSPPARLLSALEDGCLYAGLFADMEVLHGLLGSHPAVTELEADLHRRLGQWELARLRWGTVAEQEPANGSALNNLGVYHLRKQDFGSAIGYLERATETEPDLVEAFFNLSQAYTGSYQFAESREALAQAQQIDRARVDGWLAQRGSDLAIPTDGSAHRHDEIRAALLAPWNADPSADSWLSLRGNLGLSTAAAVLLLALALHVVRRRFGYSDRVLGGRRERSLGWRLVQALVPGWWAAEHGRGGRGFVMIVLVVALIALPVAIPLRYRLPVLVDLGSGLLLAVSAVGLMLFALVRLGHIFASGERR